ncbi:MAG: transposase, partial [Acidobacteriota bacterium]
MLCVRVPSPKKEGSKLSVTLESSPVQFSSLGGLALFDEMIAATRLRDAVTGDLPKSRARPLASAFQKFRALLFGFVAGADCLDDMDKLAEDEGFAAVAKSLSDSTTYGNFLRSFDLPMVRRLNSGLSDLAFKIRSKVAPDDDFVLDLDSTKHEQSAKKMEGLGYAEGQYWGLTSLQAFDQFGLQYWMDVREGTAFTANGASLAITQIFRKVPRGTSRFLRADAGYCNADVFNACHTSNVKFVTPMRWNMLEPLISSVRHWHVNRRLRTKAGRLVEARTTLYRP